MSKKNSSSGSNESGVTNKKYLSSVLGGLPPKKDKDAIASANSPRANGTPKGTVRK